MEQTIREPLKTETSVATVAEFLKAIEPHLEAIPVPEIGPGKVIKIKPLSLADRTKLRSACEDRMTGKLDVDQFEAMAIIHCTVEPKFTPEALASIREANVKVIDRVAQAIFSLSAVSETESALKKG